MPLLKYLADTNALSDYMRGEPKVTEWFDRHENEIALNALSLAELRRGIELRPEGKARRELERKYRFLQQDYSGAIFGFDESSAYEWGRLMAEARNHPLPYEDSLIAAIARGLGLKVLTRNARHFPGCATVDPWTGLEQTAWNPPC